MIHIRIQRNEVGATNPESIEGLHISLEGESIKSFRSILHRALNTWPACPAEWKDAADMIEHGKILQLYEDGHHTSSRKSGDIATPDELEYATFLILTFGTEEWKAYLYRRHEESLSAYHKKMREKYPAKA